MVPPLSIAVSPGCGVPPALPGPLTRVQSAAVPPSAVAPVCHCQVDGGGGVADSTWIVLPLTIANWLALMVEPNWIISVPPAPNVRVLPLLTPSPDKVPLAITNWSPAL